MPDVFVSYARADQASAHHIANALSDAGLDVWWDNALRSGEAFDDAIEQALRQSKAVVVLWSPASVASRWVRAEATLADRLGTILPVMLTPCERPIIFELLHTPDLTGWTGDTADRQWHSLLADIRHVIAGERQLASDRPTPVQIARGTIYRLPSKPSIAVLPFVDMSSGGAQAFLADGIVEEVSIALSNFTTLFVIAGASSLTYKGQNKQSHTICRELGVRYLLEGTVRQAAGRIRVNIKLIDGIEGEQVWAEKFEGGLDDIFDLQDRIAVAVAARIDSTIDTAEVARAATRPPSSSPDANELYWRANALFRHFDPAALAKAITLAEQALQLDPNHSWAASLAAFCHATCYSYGWTSDRQSARDQAMAHYTHAMQRGGQDIRVLGYCAAAVMFIGEDLPTAAKLTDRLLQMNPGSATALSWGAWSDVVSGNPVRGLERIEASLRLNPVALIRPQSLTAMGLCLFQLTRFEEAADVLHEAVQHLPNFPTALSALAASLAFTGRLEEAHSVALRLNAASRKSTSFTSHADAEHAKLLRKGLDLAMSVASNP